MKKLSKAVIMVAFTVGVWGRRGPRPPSSTAEIATVSCGEILEQVQVSRFLVSNKTKVRVAQALQRRRNLSCDSNLNDMAGPVQG